ncbi:hypothetical protein DB30_02707 [Enhygromyxa salina]|uniref:Uncharacterized protein n=1 Tax=Enhygromyxa salina TaxID=215803 RepID=A0A0C2D8J3_9BACT|nr:hypothetical protein DB30_02707 [Enhygromyxa salina]
MFAQWRSNSSGCASAGAQQFEQTASAAWKRQERLQMCPAA